MEKIGIITLNGYFNYGNRLQNYALQSLIEKNEYSSETILVERVMKQTCNEKNNSRLKKIMKMSLKDKFTLLKIKINSKKNLKITLKREAVFKEFSNLNLNETNYKINTKKIPGNLKDSYKFFVTGSDQVWNPNDEMFSEVNFLTFAPIRKRIAYAPSFGVSKVQKEYLEDYKEWISGIHKISVRENEGAKIIKDLTGIEALVVLDPTMLISKKEWLNISKKDINKPKKKYLLTYFLGGISKEYKMKIKEISKKEKLQIVDLANINEKRYYVNGPSEFIDYINSAKVFFTDSFHGCVFSLLMDTPFVVCDRKGQNQAEQMSSRIDTFVSKFKLEDRKFENLDFNNIFTCDYTKSNEILEKEKEKSIRFLKEALNVEINEEKIKGEKIEV